MYERFTQPARRAVYFAAMEARDTHSAYLETQHYLLGILKVDEELFAQLGIRDIKPLAEACRSFPPTALSKDAGDIPVDNQVRTIYSRSAEEADRLGHRDMGPQHLLLGLLATPNKLSDALKSNGLTYAAVRAFCVKGK